METIQEVMEKYHLTKKEYELSEGGSYYTVENIEAAMAEYADQFKVKNLAQPDVIRSFFCLSTGNQPEYKRACMNQCSWCKEHQHQFQQAQIDKMTVTIKTTIIHEVQKNGV